ncbi:hypothetical protein ACVW0Y_001522 [Pseudomonas sp. TE3786]
MHHPTTPRLSLLTLATLATLAMASNAHAMRNGTQLIGGLVPHWAVGNFSCSGTLITPRVVLTAGHCTEANPTLGFYHRLTGQVYYGNTASYPQHHGPFGDVGIVMMDTRFGGSGDVSTAPIATYQEEKQVTQGSDNPATSKTPLVIYAKDTPTGNFSTNARIADAYWDPRHNDLSVIPDGPPMIYRSAHTFRALEPERMVGTADNGNFFKPGLVQQLSLNLLSDQNIDKAVIIAAATDALGENGGSPIFAGDSGGGIFFRMPNQTLRFFGVVSSVYVHTRASRHWPWVVQTLIDKGLRDDAISLSKKVLGIGDWGSNDRRGQVGQIYVYDNPYTHKIEYFRLASVDSSGRYGYFPINKKDNEYWEYLGTTLPDFEQATTPLGVWGANDKHGTLGDIYIYNNPYSRQVEYFRLTNLGSDGRYWYFPINQKDNEYWKYLGTDLPTQPADPRF